MRSLTARLAALAVGGAYAATLTLCRLRPRARGSWRRTGHVAVCGTFHNPNWFRAHATPLGRSGVGQVTVVTDREQPEVAGVHVVCPPRWLRAALGRAGAKLVWTLRLGRHVRPDLYMGYHILPNSLVALWAGRLFGRPTCYQMTSGPSEVEGGGYRADNALLRRLGAPSARLERLALATVKEFDLVVVRGRGARRFLADHGVHQTAVITGSVDAARFSAPPERPFDLVHLGQLIERKRPLEFVEIVAAASRARPTLRALIVGDGPLRDAVHRRRDELDLARHLDVRGQTAEVEEDLARARIFVLTSRSEGLSIAMAEAMMAGTVPVVSDVGDLRDLVRDGVTGYLVAPDDRAGFVDRITHLLSEPERWARLSAAAAAAARAHAGLDHVSGLWARHLTDAMRAHGATSV